ncbi:MAG: nucleoside monophosphate kinase [bacterium]
MEEFEKIRAAVRGKKILLFGPPGSGKGNRARDLEALGLIPVASGIALRAKVRDDAESELSRKALGFMKAGELVPDEIVTPIVMEHLRREECRENGFVLDGFPRTKSQADFLFSRIELDLVLLLQVPRKFLAYGVVEANRRVCVKCAKGYSDFDPPARGDACDRCGGDIVKRADDTSDTLQKRLNLYDEQTMALLPDLEVKGIVVALPITVGNDVAVDPKHLKMLRGEVYWTETDQGDKARMLNFDGMRQRLFDLLASRFL